MHRTRYRFLLLFGALALYAVSSPAAAHAGSLNLSGDPSPIPNWVFALTGGGVVVISFLFTSLVTDSELVHALRGPEYRLHGAFRQVPEWATTWIINGLGVGGLLLVLIVGLFGPAEPLANLGVLLVWVGWWAGYTMSTYLVGNTWPMVNPWRTIADYLPSLRRPYPESVGRWPSVVGLLALVFVEVVTPLADDPRLLALVVLGYSIVTLGGTVVYGVETWFERVDPIAGVFRFYGTLAPVQWRDGRAVLVPPASRISESDLLETDDDIGFVIALLWVTTYDGLVSTPAGGVPIRIAAEIGIPPVLGYALLLVVGFGAFLGIFYLGVRGIRWFGTTFVQSGEIARRFAPTLLPIAAAYHLAHFLGYFLELLPALVASLVNPLSAPVSVPVVALPGFVGGIELALVVVGHVVAVWAAHGTAFDLFSGRVQPIRSQFPLVAIMVAYTMTSMWIISQPFSAPPYV